MQMPRFYVKVFRPYGFDDGGETHEVCWPKNNDPTLALVISAKTAELAAKKIAAKLPELEEKLKKLLDAECSEFLGKKGYSLVIVKMDFYKNTIWKVPSDSEAKAVYINI